MIEFVEYRDDKIKIKLPKQLRQKRPIRFFQGNLVRGKPETQVMVGVDINFDARRVEAVKKIYIGPERKQPVSQPEGYKIHRSGPCRFGEDGLEILTSVDVRDKGYTLYRWDLLYRLQGHYVELTIMGGGSLKNFESMAKEIITSLKLLSPAESKKRLNASSGLIKSIKQGGLKAKDGQHNLPGRRVDF